MNPKMSIKDAAAFLNSSPKQVLKKLVDAGLPYQKSNNAVFFDFKTARQLFKLALKPKAIAFQIVKGGTGKTSLACAVAMRANLYGLRVLCIDLDQQGNMTQGFGINADTLPVMVDILAEGYSYESAIRRVYPGLSLLGSRIENALIDDVIKLKKLPLAKVYKEAIDELKSRYDLIVIDCPPNLGQSVSAATLAVDKVISPVIPEQFALSGLEITYKALQEIEESYETTIPFNIVLNKYDSRQVLSQEALKMLRTHSLYQSCLLASKVRNSQEFPHATINGVSIYDSVKASNAKKDLDALTQEVLGISPQPMLKLQAVEPRSSSSELPMI